MLKNSICALWFEYVKNKQQQLQQTNKKNIENMVGISLRSADAFPVVASLGGREATTGNASALPRLTPTRTAGNFVPPWLPGSIQLCDHVLLLW